MACPGGRGYTDCSHTLDASRGRRISFFGLGPEVREPFRVASALHAGVPGMGWPILVHSGTSRPGSQPLLYLPQRAPVQLSTCPGHPRLRVGRDRHARDRQPPQQQAGEGLRPAGIRRRRCSGVGEVLRADGEVIRGGLYVLHARDACDACTLTTRNSRHAVNPQPLSPNSHIARVCLTRRQPLIH